MLVWKVRWLVVESQPSFISAIPLHVMLMKSLFLQEKN
jgi:hypothetical protein